MNVKLRRVVFWGVLAAFVVVGLVFTFRPQPVAVDITIAARGPLAVSADDDGETRVHDIFVVSAPVTGLARRVEWHAGDPVEAFETVIAEIEPTDPTFLDPRSEAQAEADVRAAESSEALARAEVEQAEAELEFAHRDYDRARELILDNTISQRELDEKERSFRTARAELATAAARLEVRIFELERARAQLLSPVETQDSRDACACVSIRSPVSGQILRVLHQSEGVVTPGMPLVEVGDPRDLEIVVDLLSAEAVRVEAGQRVIIENWGGDEPLEGRVRLVEPFGFTKISALGIEEKRVNVIIDFVSPPEEWAALAHGYQVDVRIVLWEDDDVLKLPLTALFRDGPDWAVFVDVNGRAELRNVGVGRRNGLEAEITNGLEAGARVVLHPSDRVMDGVRIADRSG